MKAHIAKRISGGLAAAASIFIFADAKAAYMPFSPTPDSFLNYANTQVIFEGGTQFKFVNPRDCRMDDYGYACTFDYREKSILGQRACRGAEAYYNKSDNRFLLDLQGYAECSEWAPVTDSASDNKNPIDYKIALTLLAGGLLGALLAYALRDKKK